MEIAEIDRIARAWINLHHTDVNSPEYEREFWAYEMLDRLCRREPEDAWRVIAKVLMLDASDEILANLAAGPLEDFLASHGEQFIDRLEDTAARDPLFRKVLGAVWQNGIHDEIWNRIRAVASPTW